jgi:hypothetical protein
MGHERDDAVCIVSSPEQVPEPDPVHRDVPGEQGEQHRAEDLVRQVLQPPIGERKQQDDRHCGRQCKAFDDIGLHDGVLALKRISGAIT